MESLKKYRRYLLVAAVLFACLLLVYAFSPLGLIVPFFAFFPVGVVVYAFWRRERALELMRYRFLTVVTHNFRTPLTGMKWTVNALREDVEREEKKNLLTKLDTAIERVQTVVEVLAGVARSDERLDYAFEAVSFHDLIEASLKRFSERIQKKELQLTIQVAQGLPLIIADRQKIQFVIDILLENAIAYSVTGAPITLTAVQQKNDVLFSVADLGSGLSREDRRHLFADYYRSEEAQKLAPDGLGLSLFTARTIVENHRGKIWVESKGKGKGSTFYVRLKIAQQGH